MVLDEKRVQEMITAKVAPLHREVSRQRRKVEAVNKRVEAVEHRVDDVESAVKTSLALVQQVISEGMGRIELKMDKQHGEIVRRLDTAEGWISGRRRIEKAAIRFGQLAAVVALRRWLPFLSLFSGIMLASYAMTMLLGG